MSGCNQQRPENEPMKKHGLWKAVLTGTLVVLAVFTVLFAYTFFRRNQSVLSEGSQHCTLSIRCDTILSNMDRLEANKKELIPKDGILLAPVTVGFDGGSSVFDVLYKAVRQENIHMEFSDSPVYNSVYIEGIGNIYEFDCGDLSGWMYSVNGEFPMFGMSQYQVKDGDVIEIVYTCDMGADVGNSYDMGGNN